MAALITLTTDFGSGSPYVAAMKGVILSLNPSASIVDVTHAVLPQDVRCGAIVLDDTTPYFPADTIHVAVVDPGVGTARALIYAKIGAAHYLAPDNGLLSLLVQHQPVEKIVRLERADLWRTEVSATFHGRDILAPVAARLSLGTPPTELGSRRTEMIRLDWPLPRLEPRRIAGAIWSVDSFGNLTTNITADLLTKVRRDGRTTVRCAGHTVQGIIRTYAERQPSELVALVGSSGRLELAVVDGNAATRLGIQAGAPVEVIW